jgi:hypothetical protein
MRPAFAYPAGAAVLTEPTPGELAGALASSNADVLIDLGPEADGSEPLPIPHGGRWRVRFADSVGGVRRSALERPAEPVALIESVLSIELPSGEALEAEVGVGSVHRIGFGRDRDAIYWRSALLPARRLARLIAGANIPSAPVDAASPASGPSRSAISHPAVPPFAGLASMLIRKVADRAFFRTAWAVFVREREPGGEPPRDLSGFTLIDPPRGRFYADPFVVATADGHRIYLEDSPLGEHHGRISTIQRAPDGEWTFERVVLDDLEHRAYPHVVRVDDGLLLTPDNGRDTGVDLFLERDDDEPPTTIAHRLDGVAASDPTILRHDDRFWLFVSVKGPGMSPWDELHLFSAASLADLWQAHPRNPIVADVRRARSAGRIFARGGELIRPGQDCSREYGERISLSVITTLTADAYEEHSIGSIEPTGFAGVRRTHTYTFDGSVEALDGYRRVARIPRFGRPRRG